MYSVLSLYCFVDLVQETSSSSSSSRWQPFRLFYQRLQWWRWVTHRSPFLRMQRLHQHGKSIQTNLVTASAMMCPMAKWLAVITKMWVEINANFVGDSTKFKSLLFNNSSAKALYLLSEFISLVVVFSVVLILPKCNRSIFSDHQHLLHRCILWLH